MPPDSLAGGNSPLILTLDIGSSSVRALLFDRRGRRVEGVGAQEHYAMGTDARGAAEMDADALIDAAVRCVDAVLAQAGAAAAEIAGVAVATFVCSLLALDARNRPLTPLITYADMRGDPDAAALRSRQDEAAVHQRTGCLLRANYWPAQLAWLRRTEPDTWRSAARWVTLGEYLELRLFGTCRVSYSAASWTGLLDRKRLAWDDPLLDLLGVGRGQLSTFADSGEPLAGLREEFGARWPALRAVPWFAALGDGAAANVGSGCAGRSRVALTVGTTGAMRLILEDVETVPPGLWCYRLDRRHALLGGATSEGGNLYAWLRQAMRLGPPTAVEAELAAFPPDGHGLTVLPFFAGERSPGWAGNVPATVHGLTLATTPLAILRAGLEAIAYRFALIHARLAGEAHAAHCLIASGSALLSSPAWMQIFADVLGRSVVASQEGEATSRGAALLALHALGLLPSLDDAPAADGAVYEPDASRRAPYRAALARQQELYAALIGSRPPAAGDSRAM